ncbi:hypothetical protein BH10PSE14_BH10PSE14_27380 [soil metagenome]
MLLLLLAAALGLDDPLAPAAAGKLQCHSPDVANKTCKSIASYQTGTDGVIRNTARLPLANEPPVALTLVSTVTVRDGAVCGFIAASDFDRGVIDVNGQALAAEKAQPIVAKVAAAMASFIGKEICTRYTANGAALMAHATIDGVAQPAFDQPVIWVDPAEGYRVKA